LPPPKSSNRDVEAFHTESPIRPPCAANGQPATDTVPITAPFLYTCTVPSLSARAPNWFPAANVTPLNAPHVAQVFGGANVYTVTCDAVPT